MTTQHPIITGILIALFGMSLGFGASQMTVVGRVATNETKIEAQRRDFEQEKIRTDERIFKLADMFKASNDLVGKSIDQSSKLLSTIEAQNKLIVEQNTMLRRQQTTTRP